MPYGSPDGPTATQLDTVVPDRPALIIDEGATQPGPIPRSTSANITAETPDPVPGVHFFQRDMLGKPTGWLVEGAAIDVTDALGVVSESTLRERALSSFPIWPLWV